MKWEETNAQRDEKLRWRQTVFTEKSFKYLLTSAIVLQSRMTATHKRFTILEIMVYK